MEQLTDREIVHRLYRELVSVATFYRSEVSAVMAQLSQELGLPKTAKFSQYDILCELYHRGSLTPTELSKIVNLTLPNVSNAIAELCELGLVERISSDTDRRRQEVSVTELGRTFGNEVMRRCPGISHVLSGGRAEADALLAHFDSIERRIREYREER